MVPGPESVVSAMVSCPQPICMDGGDTKTPCDLKSATNRYNQEIQKPQSQGFAEALRHGPGQHVFNAFGEGTQSRKEDMRVVIIVWGPPLFPQRGGSGSGYHIL